MFDIKTEKEIKIKGRIEPNMLINGDCLDMMQYIPDSSIDAIIVDPPFG